MIPTFHFKSFKLDRDKISSVRIMAVIETYPNPVRIFTQARNVWFLNILSKFKMPPHVFTSIRESQLGQLMFAIETMRIKKLRDGEDPGESIFDGEQSDMFVPVFQNIKSLEDFFDKDDVGARLEDYKGKILESDEIKDFLENGFDDNEWFSPLDFDRLDELYEPTVSVVKNVIYPIFEEVVGDTEGSDLFEKVNTMSQGFGAILKSLHNEINHTAIIAKKYTVDDTDSRIRLLEVEDGDPIQLHYNEYYSQITSTRSFILEILRKLKLGKKYSRKFTHIPEIFSLEMLLMLPQPDKTRLSVVKTHLATLKDEFNKKKLNIPMEFYSILTQSFQALILVFDPHQRMFQKVLKNQEKSFKQLVRQFWRRMTPLLTSGTKKTRENAETILAVIWSHFRIVQAQAQHATQNPDDEHDHQNLQYRMMLRFEHMFWRPAINYTQMDDIVSPTHFWLAFAKIVNFEIRTPKDSTNLFGELEDLYQRSRVLSNKTKRKKYGVTVRDHKSLLKTIISYGVESRNPELFATIKKRNEELSKLLDVMGATIDDFPEVNIEEEQKVVDQVRTFVEMSPELFVDPTPQQPERGRRSLRKIKN